MIAPTLIWLSALAAQSEVSGGSGNPATEGFAALFVEACINGELRLTPDVGVPADSDDLQFAGNDRHYVKQIQYFRIKKPGPGHLEIIDWHTRHPDGWERSCAIGSDLIETHTAWKIVARALTGKETRSALNTRTYTLDVPARRFRLRVGQNHMETIIFNEATAAKMLAEQKRLNKKAPVRPVAKRSPW